MDLYYRDMTRKPDGPLRRGWTTGACATAQRSITLPKGEQPSFPLAREALGDGFALAGIVKDAGDDPDVTHCAEIIVRVQRAAPGSGVRRTPSNCS